MDLLLRLEQSGFSVWVRESTSLFAFPGILLLHTIGIGLVAGVNAGIDLRILGLASGLPLAPMEKFLPVLWVGFWINAASGIVLLVADAATKLVNADFYVKMLFIVLAVINLRLLKTRVFSDPLLDKKPLSMNAKILAVTSLICWLGAITAGRLMAYVGAVTGLSQK